MLPEFQRMWNEHFVQTRAAKHQIELTSENWNPINSALHRAVHRAWELNKHEMNEMLAVDVIEQSQQK